MINFSKKIVGYSDQISLKPSEKITFMVSCEPQIKIIYSKIVKLIHGDCNPSGPGYKDEELKSYGKKKHKAIHQKINSGSYILIPLIKKITLSKDFTFISFIFPTLDNNSKQSIIASNYSNKEKLNLFINDKFSLQLQINKKNILKLRSKFREKYWYLIGFTYSALNYEIKLFQYPVKHDNCEPELKKKKIKIKSIKFENCLSFASSIISNKDHGIINSDCYNGKIDSPKFLNTYLTENHLLELSKRPNKLINKKNIFSCWDFSKYISSEKIIILEI